MPAGDSKEANEALAKGRAAGAPSPAISEGAVPAVRPAPPVTPADRKRAPNRRLILGVIALVIVVVGFIYGVPVIKRILETVSTDDAYVNGHVTFVAARVPGQVMRVLVDDNNRVRKGDLIVELDKEPYQIQVNLKQATFDTAKANRVAAEDEVRSRVAQTRSARFKLQHAIETVDNQIAVLRANVAALETKKATLTRANADYERAKDLAKTPGAIAPQDVDLRRESFLVAQAQVSQALEAVYQVRVGLGLPAKPEKGDDLTQVPPDLDQNYSSVRQALAELLQNAAQFGVIPSSYNLSPKEIVAEFYKRDPQGNLDRIYAQLIKNAPEIQQTDAKLEEAKSDLDQAKLNLRYCDVYAEIDGVITRRNVNPGNNVQAGQGLMAIRSLTEIWIDANFKETQLANLRIGQRAELEVDMYGRHKTFTGRITGFTMGTGSTLALLPAQNATGNFIKVVQRLPVRIDLVDYKADEDPLFIGLSVVPHVYINERAVGPDAGKFLQPLMPTAPPVNTGSNPTAAAPMAAPPAGSRATGPSLKGTAP